MQSVTDKEKFRRTIKETSYSEEARRESDNKIQERFFSEVSGEHKKVFVYVSVGEEAGTETIIKRYIDLDVEVYVPLCYGKGRMEAKRIFSMSDLIPGRYNIPEPSPDAPSCEPGELSLVIVPGVAFGEDLSRLGRGAGYYDRFLEKAENAMKVALCYEANIFKTVPCEEHDIFMDMIVTEKRIIKEMRGR